MCLTHVKYKVFFITIFFIVKGWLMNFAHFVMCVSHIRKIFFYNLRVLHIKQILAWTNIP